MKVITYQGTSCGFMPRVIGEWYQRAGGWFIWDFFEGKPEYQASIKQELRQ